MSHYLSPTTHLAKIADDVVVLDARNSTYFCLPGAAEAISIGVAAITFSDPDLADEFSAAGLLADVLPPPPPAARDLGQQAAPRIAFRDVVLIAAAWVTMFSSYHAVDFNRVVETARRERRSGLERALSDELKSLVAAFERILPWLPAQGVCFYRSFLLLRVLRWRGFDARWVFGVRTWPFEAHCWLQIGDVVLDDTADRLSNFSPIMVV